MVKTHTCITIDASYIEEAKRQGFKLSSLLENLLGEHLHLTSDPAKKKEEAVKLAIKSDDLLAEATLQEQTEAEKVDIRFENIKKTYRFETDAACINEYNQMEHPETRAVMEKYMDERNIKYRNNQ